MKQYKVEGHTPSNLPEEKNWNLVWSDEFDGTELDSTKWDYRLHIMHERHNTYTNEGAILDGEGCLHLKLIERDGQYYSSQLQTGYNFMDEPPATNYGKLIWPIAKFKEPKFMHKYGYYEVRCKMQKKPGWWSAFWLQSPTIGCSLNPETSGVEIDIMESFEPGVVIPHCLHWAGYGADHKGINSTGKDGFTDKDKVVLEKTVDGFHTFGLDWSTNGYTFYIDGKQNGKTINGPVSDIEQFILLSTECNGYRNGDTPHSLLTKENLPDEFIVDYVRVFDEVK